MKLHHIGIAVKNLENSCDFFKKVFTADFSKPEYVDSQKVIVSYSGNIELIQATQEKSPLHPIMKHPILNFIEKNGEGPHHLCFEVENLSESLDRLAKQGITPLSEEPQQGSNNSKIIFLNPRLCNNMLIELKELSNE